MLQNNLQLKYYMNNKYIEFIISRANKRYDDLVNILYLSCDIANSFELALYQYSQSIVKINFRKPKYDTYRIFLNMIDRRFIEIKPEYYYQ